MRKEILTDRESASLPRPTIVYDRNLRTRDVPYVVHVDAESLAYLPTLLAW